MKKPIIISRSDYSHKLAVTAVMLSVSIVLNMFFELSIPIVGASPIFRIRLSSAFLNLPAILYGGVYGGIVWALNDIISYLIRPMGAFHWEFTVTSFLKGFSIGWLWWRFVKMDAKWFSLCYFIAFLCITAWGLANLLLFLAVPDSRYVTFLLQAFTLRDIDKIISYNTISLLTVIVGVTGLLSYIPSVISLVRLKKDGIPFDGIYLKLLIAVGVPSLIITTINTYVMLFKELIPSRAFLLALLPRFVSTLIITLVMTYVLRFLMGVYSKMRNGKNHEKNTSYL